MKKILYVDEYSNSLKILNKLLVKKYEVDSYLIEEKALESFKKNSYDVIIVSIDGDSMFGYSLVNTILTLNPNQKVITFTMNPFCALASIKEGCEYCQTYYKKLRMELPIRFNKLVEYIENFENYKCEYVSEEKKS